MSNNKMSNNKMSNNKMSSKKPFCKICHDAGKPESEYANHWVKDLNGKTTCPTLLNTECRYCFKRGHTAKFCAVLAKNNKETKPIVQNKPAIMNKPVFQKKPVNGFAVLCNDDDEEELTNIVLNLKPVEKTSWASIASKPKIDDVKPLAEVKPSVTQDQVKKPKSWADWSDSEDEDEPVYDAW
jgi:hypothetical protein